MSVRLLASAGIALAVCACSFEPALTAKFVDYNRAFEDSSNSILLLNVLRAKDRKPLYFSTVSQLNPTIGATGELQLNIPLSPASYTSLGVNTRGSVNTSNTATVATEHTHEFMRGFLQPLSIELFDYFWQQGWPRDVLLHLFVYKIEIAPKAAEGAPKKGTYPESEVLVFVNSPPSRGDVVHVTDPKDCAKVIGPDSIELAFGCFQFVADRLKSLLRFASEDAKAITPALPAPGIQNWKVLVDAAKPDAKLAVVYRNGTVQITKKGPSTVLCISNPNYETDDHYHRRSSAFPCPKYGTQSTDPERGVAKTLLADQRPPKAANSADSRLERLRKEYADLKQLCKHPKGECEVVLHMRSPEAMIYYLGEAARALSSREPLSILLRKMDTKRDEDDASACASAQRKDKRFLALLALERGGAGSTLASVTYESDRYTVPKHGCHRTMQVLSLVTIVLGLHRRATDLPRTGTVNVVGQ